LKQTIKIFLQLACALLLTKSSFTQDQCTPVGWATQNGGTTGGGNAAVTVVTTYNALKAAITSTSVKVVHISGTIIIPQDGRISFQDQSGKTIFGLPGSKLVSTDLTHDSSGILYIKRCSNIILRNLTFEGPGAYDADGWDNVTIDNSTNMWIDHCEFQDGMDGNLDIKNAANYISITWCKFIYNKPPIPGGSGGSNDHRFSNLFGSADDATGDRGKLNITMQYCWWAQGCKARMPRVRFGKVHVVNSFFNSTASSQCVMAGFEADLLVESNVFENVNTPIDLVSHTFTAITQQNNIFTNTSGNTVGSGTAFTPPYALVISPATDVKEMVSNATCGAGATMTGPANCGCSAIYSLTATSSPVAGGSISKSPSASLYPPNSTVTVTATPAAGYEFASWSGDASGTDPITSITMTSNKVITANFQPLVAPTLSADITQPGYAGTSTPFLSIVSGSGKTSYVSAVINDPTDPAATAGIVFTVTGSSLTVTGTSNNTAVISNSNIIVTPSAGKYTVKLIPTGIGYAKINFVASNAVGNSATYTIQYAASTASLNPLNTIFHTAASDASGASVIDSNYMFVADDENNLLRLYDRRHSGKQLYSFDISSAVGASSECDLEASSTSVKYNAGKRLYWIGSLGNNKSGDLKSDRNKVVATDVAGTGAASTLTVKSYSNQMRNALISWGNTNGWNFTTSAASGMIPKRIDGFNVEGLSVTHGGDTAYIGFRAPCVPVKGITPNASNRKYAILAPINNFETIMNGSGQVATTPLIGEPILFDLEGLGIRSVEKTASGKYLIVAGLFTGGGSPAVYLWDGVVPANPGKTVIDTSSPVSKLIKLRLPDLKDLAQVSPDGQAEGHPEAMIANVEGNILNIRLLSDNGTVDFYNDGTEAKSLSHDEFKKFRSDLFTCSIDTTGSTINLCPGSSSTLISSNLSGASYAWQWDTCGTGNCFTSISDDIHFTGTSSKVLQLTNIPSNWNRYKFRCITHGNNSNEYTIKISVNWTGAINNNWETAGNWDCNSLPNEFTDVFIKNGSPVLNTSTAIRSLQLSNAANLSITNSNNLSIRH
jgi:uncharacterized repeat protein (TIGR02543 family)